MRYGARRIIGGLTGSALLVLAAVVPPMPLLFVVLGALWSATFVLPEIYGE